MKKLLALLLAAAMLFSLCACSSSYTRVRDAIGQLPEDVIKGSPPPQETGHSPYPADYTPHFEPVWHEDIAFADIEYVHYLPAWFDEYTGPIYDFAQYGGTAEDFANADYDLIDELYYIHTLMTVKELEYMSNPSNAAVADELAYIQDVFYAAYEEYYVVMHTLAASPHASLMAEGYGSTLMELFEGYEPDDGSEAETNSEENALVQTYYRLMASGEPDWDAIGAVYVELVRLRQDQAALYGYDSYADYAYDSLYYKDYTPQDAQHVLKGVKTQIVPVLRKYETGVWLTAMLLNKIQGVDCSSDAILAAMASALQDMSPELYEAYEYMLDYGLYDIAPSPNKADRGYTTTLYYVNQPFIFYNPDGALYDYTGLFHEFGHFANAYYTQSDLLFGMADYDLCELQSQGMEILFTHYYDEIFGEHANTAEKYLIWNLANSLVDGAMYDEFQQRVYAEPDISLERVNEIFLEVYSDYGYVPYEGCEQEWMYISHNFDDPFYYISYCVSALGALELYARAQEDWPGALDQYLDVLAMDSEAYYYSEALEESGLGSIFDQENYAEIASALEAVFTK